MRRLPAALGAVLVVIFLPHVAAAAPGGIPAPPPPEQSRCAQVGLTPAIVKPGGRLTVSVSGASAACGGPPSSVIWNYPGINQHVDEDGYRQVKPCARTRPRASTRSSSAMPPSPTAGRSSGWRGSSPAGAWSSTTPVYLDTKGYFQIFGTVVDKLLNGQPDVVVRLTGQGQHQKFKSLDGLITGGEYSFAVRKKGSYTLSVKKHGRTFSTTVVVRHKFGNIPPKQLTI